MRYLKKFKDTESLENYISNNGELKSPVVLKIDESINPLVFSENIPRGTDLVIYKTGGGVDVTGVNNIIKYTTTNNSVLTLSDKFGDAVIIENTYIDGIGTIVFDRELTTIEDSAFASTTIRRILKSIILPKSIKSIGEKCFYRCINLIEIQLWDTVVEIGNAAFSNLSTTGTITINISNDINNYLISAISSRNPFTSGNKLLRLNNKAVTEIHLPNNLTNASFKNCSELTEISIPSNYTKFTSDYFKGCSSIKKVYYDGDINDWLSITFDNTFSNPMYYGAELFLNNEKLIEVNLNNLQPTYHFIGCTSLEKVTASGIETIGSYAFYNCTSLKEISLPDTLNSIGSSAFYNCTSLKNIKIPSKVSTIGLSTFKNCTSLEKVELSEGLLYIQESAFYDCSSLVDIQFPSTLKSIGQTAFYRNSSLTEIIIPEVFNDAALNLTFLGCTSLKTVYWNATNTTYKVANRSGLDGASIENIYIGENVTAIPMAFCYEMTTVKNIFIPKNTKLTTFKTLCFYGATNLSITYDGTVSEWSTKSYTNTSSNSGVIVHCTDGDTTL